VTGFDPSAYDALADRDAVLARLISVYGHPPPFGWHDGGRTGHSKFAAMALHMIGQQISAVAAFAIYDRLAAATAGIPTPRAIEALGSDRLMATGAGRSKASSLQGLARAQLDGIIDIEDLCDRDDETVIAALTALPGIGLWTAQTFLIHNLARPDVLPATDGGIRPAVATQWHLADLPGPAAVAERGLRWKPYRSYAAALLWRSLAPAGQESDPKARALRSVNRARP
jgi:3-methyladenine DNA glycosylase/8-oxoguanine DNA glycosylase